ncbi:DUF4376 domain-containing protein [Thalassobaculum sp. OXR-137]|uniref:DUF4376 domain-containing protein n=1 Tax=Thalassobaculum sp. OXR-137 TaxID=3100173 RepID=UPI002AC96E4F|nr:DUF4376 domain-containing protein [Thalassobaculum sp. OXR-137]WPZ36714.1 DUF4376 domain-containing protein [Thalassobaculum sp. OXR-137]
MPTYDPATEWPANWNGTAWIVSDMPVAARKGRMKAAATQHRWEVETGGITVSGVPVATDALTQAKLSGARQLAQDDDQITIKWKSADGTWVTLDATAVTAIARAVGLHVQACFAQEEALHAAIDDAADHDDLDLINTTTGTITTIVEGEPVESDGWPS